MWGNRYVKGHNGRREPSGLTLVDIPPDLPPYHVERRRLFELLEKATQGRLTLISAPAGWGKTTLLAAWARSAPVGLAVRWAATTPNPAPRGLSPPGSGPPAGTAATAGEHHPLRVLVFDNVHPEDAELISTIQALAESTDRSLRVIVSGRQDLPLPLYQWRLRDELTLLGPSHLSLSTEETAALLANHHVALDDHVLAELHALAEGWPAAARLAALAMQGHPEPEHVLTAFVQHDRTLEDYVAREILAAFDPDVRSLLAQTSILDRMSAELVEALTARTDAHSFLHTMLRHNVVTVSRDGGPPWYRLHPMVGPMLYNQLLERDPLAVFQLHARASRFFEQMVVADAIRHALAARDWDRAVTLVRERWWTVLPGGRVRAKTAKVGAPPEALRNPWLALAFAAERLDAADPKAADAFVALAEAAAPEWPDPAGDLPHVLKAFRTAQAYLGEDVQAFASRELRSDWSTAETGLPQDAVRALALLVRGASHTMDGRADAAEPVLLKSLELAEKHGMTQVHISAVRELAVLNMVRANLHAAREYANMTLDLARRHSIGRNGDTFWAELVLAEVCYQRDRIDAAAYHLDRALGAGSLSDMTPAGLVAMVRARIGAITGPAPAALASLSAARKRLTVVAPLPALARSLVLAEAQLSLVCGEIETASRLLQQHALDNPLPAWSAVIRARLHLIENRFAAAASVLAPYLSWPQPSRLWQLEANLLHAHALVSLGGRVGAGQSLERALTIAEEEGIRRPFTELGQHARELLTNHLPVGSRHRRLADVIIADLAAPQPPALRPTTMDVPLTDRELTVLRYLQSMMSTAEIAEVLYLSVNTVKTHLKSIYRKLGTGRRRDAVERARELQLL